jgi:hypothetical protein
MMNWAELNAHEDIERDRYFCVNLRPEPNGEQHTVTVKMEPFELFDMARHGPLMPQLRAAVINYATKILNFQTRRQKVLPLHGFRWFGDPVIEVRG